MREYVFDVTHARTGYVRAATEAEARRKARAGEWDRLSDGEPEGEPELVDYDVISHGEGPRPEWALISDGDRLKMWSAELRAAVGIGDTAHAAYLARAIATVANRVAGCDAGTGRSGDVPGDGTP